MKVVKGKLVFDDDKEKLVFYESLRSSLSAYGIKVSEDGIVTGSLEQFFIYLTNEGVMVTMPIIGDSIDFMEELKKLIDENLSDAKASMRTLKQLDKLKKVLV
jgi:hypothetical protein